MKKKYRVVLPIEVDGVFHGYDEIVELSLDAATLYKHALIAVEEEQHGRDS